MLTAHIHVLLSMSKEKTSRKQSRKIDLTCVTLQCRCSNIYSSCIVYEFTFFLAVHTCVNAGLFFAMLRLFTKCGICRYNTYSTEFSWWISHLFSIFSITTFGKRLMKIYSLEWGYNLKSRECEVYCLIFRILLNSFWTNFTNSSSSSVSLEKMKIKYFSKIDLSSIFAQKNK